MFWNSFCRENSQIRKEIDEVYARNLSETYEKKSDVNSGVLDKVIKREQELIQNEYFYISDFLTKERLEILMKQTLEKNPIDEDLKNIDPLKWLELMNNYKNLIEESIFKEIRYV